MTTPTLRRGDVGAAVVTLQSRLNDRHGVPVAVDGHFGPATEAAVRAFQTTHGLVVDGIAGPRTQAALLNQAPDPKALTEADVVSAAADLGCDDAAVHAILEVEAPNGGFLPDGRVRILFERHIFYRQLDAAGRDAAAAMRAAPYICNTQSGGYVGGAAEYARLARAEQIDVPAALESASWGRMQLMGFHWQALGYARVGDFVAAMQTGEAAQLRAGVKFIKLYEAMHQALIAHDWAGFAERYNGPAYAAHAYDLKLAAAYRRYAPDAPAPAHAVDTAAPAKPARRRKRKAAPATGSEASA